MDSVYAVFNRATSNKACQSCKFLRRRSLPFAVFKLRNQILGLLDFANIKGSFENLLFQRMKGTVTPF